MVKGKVVPPVEPTQTGPSNNLNLTFYPALPPRSHDRLFSQLPKPTQVPLPTTALLPLEPDPPLHRSYSHLACQAAHIRRCMEQTVESFLDGVLLVTNLLQSLGVVVGSSQMVVLER